MIFLSKANLPTTLNFIVYKVYITHNWFIDDLFISMVVRNEISAYFSSFFFLNKIYWIEVCLIFITHTIVIIPCILSRKKTRYTSCKKVFHNLPASFGSLSVTPYSRPRKHYLLVRSNVSTRAHTFLNYIFSQKFYQQYYINTERGL